MEDLNLFNVQVEEAKLNLAKFNKNGNKAAGTRARKALQAIKNTSQRLRVEVQEKKNNM